MIKTLSIKNIATFDTDGIIISDLKKISFIYGTNGSGKTTITNFIQNQDDKNFQDCSIEWKNEIQLNPLVYNKQFRENNFGTENIDGIFTLGQATKEQIEEIETKKKELNTLKEKGIKKKDTLKTQKEKLEDLISDFKEHIWYNIYKVHENEFKEAFVGHLNKNKFKDKIIHEYDRESSDIIPEIDELKERAKVLFGTMPVLLDYIPIIDNSEIETTETNNIWNKKIIGKADIEISKLIQTLNINDWVNEGREYITDNNICPFCQQETITPDFKKQIEEFFDETYKQDINSLKLTEEKYIQLFENILNTLYQIESQEKENKKSKLNIISFSAKVKTLSSFFITNKERILNKIKEPSRNIELQSTKNQLLEIIELIKNTNIEIEKHNKIVDNYSTEKRKLITDIWIFIIKNHSETLHKFSRKKNGLKTGIEKLNIELTSLRKDYKELEEQIKEENKNVTSVQPTVDAINDILKSYGFLNFEIVPSSENEKQYQIKREDGSIAKTTLSEGEVTFITFLYFLQLAKGSKTAENVLEDRVLIIDDPISSLDSNVLFLVSSLIKELIKNVKNKVGSIKQIIILTHNVYFHKEVSFIDGRTKENNDTFFWILRKNDNKTTIQCYERQNPIQNSYELLWQELKNQENNTSSLTIQNIMRRIIENYFKILGKYGDDELINAFTNPQEKNICRSLISWINDGSHSMPDDLFIEQQESITEKYFEVFKRIFIEMEQIEHYNMMMK